MKKKLLCIALSLAMCFGMLPMMAQAEENLITITSSPEAFLDAPVAGQPIPFTLTVPENAPYYAIVTRWEKVADPGSGMADTQITQEDNATFTDGRYRLHVIFQAVKAYQFDTSGVCGNPVVHSGDENWVLEHTTKSNPSIIINAVGSIYVGDVNRIIKVNNLEAVMKAPVEGQSPDYTLAVPDNAPYTADIVSWKQGGDVLQPDAKFQNDLYYVAAVQFHAKPGYEFPFLRSDLTLQIRDENGTVDCSIDDANLHDCNATIRYKVEPPRLTDLHLMLTLPKVGQTPNDLPLPAFIPPEDSEKYDLKHIAFIPSGEFIAIYPNKPFQSDKTYCYSVEAYIKEGYHVMNESKPYSITAVDQYGRDLEPSIILGSDFQQDGTSQDYVQLRVNFTPVSGYFAVFRVVNGTWASGSSQGQAVRLHTADGKLGFNVADIPTGMVANPGYGGGEWDVDPKTNCNDLSGDVVFTYTFTKVEDSATVTMKIVNGSWTTDPEPSNMETYHSNDIVIEVPLVNGVGTINPDIAPTCFLADSGCIDGAWDVEPDYRQNAITGDVTYTYTYKRVVSEPLTYTINYDVNGGDPESAPAAETETVLEAAWSLMISDKVPTREGYRFTGWNTNPDGSGTGTNVLHTITLEYDQPILTLYAQWEQAESVKVTFVADDAYLNTIPKPMTVFRDESENFIVRVPYIPCPYREGYEFTGYRLVPVENGQPGAGSDTLYQPGDCITLSNAGSYQLVAQWKAKQITLTYDANGGTGAPPSETKVLGDSPYAVFTLSPIIPTREGYEFKGWYFIGEGNTKTMIVENFRIDADTTIYALWDKADSPDNPTPDKPNSDNPNPDKPNSENPSPDRPSPNDPNSDNPNPDKPSDSAGPGVPDNVPKTGDSSHFMLWALLCIVSLGGIAALLALDQKEKHSTC